MTDLGDRPRVGGRPRLAGSAALIPLLLVAVACSGGFGPDDSDAAVVHGRVTARLGGPVADATVNVTAYSGNCDSSLSSSVSTRTDSSGRYVTSIVSFSRRLRSCLEVRAVPPDGSGLRPGVELVPNVSPSRDGADSLRVDLELDSVSAE